MKVTLMEIEAKFHKFSAEAYWNSIHSLVVKFKKSHYFHASKLSTLPQLFLQTVLNAYDKASID